MKMTLAAILTSVLSLIACSHPTAPDRALAFTSVWKEQQTGLRSPREEVISTETRWREVFGEIVSNRFPKPAAPVIDFATSSVILVARGEIGDSCRSIVIEQIEADEGTYRVAVQDLRPPMSCSCPAVTVQPVHAVAAPRVAAAVSVRYRSVTLGGGCN